MRKGLKIEEAQRIASKKLPEFTGNRGSVVGPTLVLRQPGIFPRARARRAYRNETYTASEEGVVKSDGFCRFV